LEDPDGFIIKLTKMEFNLATGESTYRYLIENLSVEFPVINQKLIGFKTKYAYISYLWKLENLPQDKAGQESIYFAGFLKYDLQKEEIVKKIDFGETKTAGEVFFSPRDGDDRDEDDGYCMSFVYDWTTEKSEFVMWDAKTMDETPVLRAETNKRVPNGFHTFFVHEDELEK